MNITEKKAYSWLIKTRGYTDKDLKFRSRKTPDFITKDGYGFEVKLAHGKNNTIWFHKKQFDEIKKHPLCEIMSDYWVGIMRGMTAGFMIATIMVLTKNHGVW